MALRRVCTPDTGLWLTFFAFFTADLTEPGGARYIPLPREEVASIILNSIQSFMQAAQKPKS
jgi:hypothetical protein